MVHFYGKWVIGLQIGKVGALDLNVGACSSFSITKLSESFTSRIV